MAETTDQRGSSGTSAARGGGTIPPELEARVREGIELLRPHPHRGDLIAAGSVPLTVALLMINLRLDDSWGTGIFFVLNALACGLVLGMGVLAPMEEERPRAYQVVLQLTGLALLFLTLFRLAQVFGTDEPLGSAWTTFLILGLVAAAATWLARERRSEICTLVAGIAGTFALLALVDWVFSPDGPATTRWILLLAALLLLAGALVTRDRHRRESVYLVDAAGVAILVLGLTFVGALLLGAFGSVGADGVLSGVAGPGALWKVVLLAAGLGLVAFAGVDREAGPGYLGALILLVFALLVGVPRGTEPSLWFWPLVLLIAGAAMIAAGLRPRQPLPPEPARGDPAPVVPAPVAPLPAAPSAAAATPPPSPEPPPRLRSRPPLSEPATPAPTPEAAPAEPQQRPPEPPEPTPEPAPDGPASASEFFSPPPVEQPTKSQQRVPPPEDEREPPAREREARPPDPPAREPEPRAPEPPARGSLWARADPGEQPTRPHRVPPRDRDAE